MVAKYNLELPPGTKTDRSVGIWKCYAAPSSLSRQKRPRLPKGKLFGRKVIDVTITFSEA